MRKHIANIKLEDEDNEINLTPMLDVVFIMLIFFIVTASFLRETGLDTNRPDQDQPQVLQDEEGAIGLITVLLMCGQLGLILNGCMQKILIGQ